MPNRAAGYEMVKGEVKNQDWVSPTLNTTADGALYLTVRDLAQWAIGLNHARVPDSAGLAMSWTPVRLNDGGTFPYGFGWGVEDQRGHLRIGHGGSWQGFRTSIQRYPGVRPHRDRDGEPGRRDPRGDHHDDRGNPRAGAAAAPSATARAGKVRREPVQTLLAGIAAGKATPKLAPGLRTFASKSMREEWSRSLADVNRWEPLGCDAVGDKGISRLGERIERICYARATGADSRLLASVAYTADWRAAALDSYTY